MTQVVLQDQVHAVLAVEDLGLFHLAALGKELKAWLGVDPCRTARSQRCKGQQEHADDNNDPDARAFEETLSFHLFGGWPRPSW